MDLISMCVRRAWIFLNPLYSLLSSAKEQAGLNRGVFWAVPVMWLSWNMNLIFLMLNSKLFKPCTAPV